MILLLIWYSLLLCQSSSINRFQDPFLFIAFFTSSSLVRFSFVAFIIIFTIFFFLFTFLQYFSFYHFYFCLLFYFKFSGSSFILNSTWVGINTILLSYLSSLSSIRLYSSSLLSNEDSCVISVITVPLSSACIYIFFPCFCCHWNSHSNTLDLSCTVVINLVTESFHDARHDTR